jgi:parvulin-like peptidyl-prolyl isomerase
MKIIVRFFLFFLLNFYVVDASEVLATVNDENITKKAVNEFVIKNIPGATFDVLNKTQKESVLNQMIERQLFLEDARKLEIEKGKDYQKALKKLQDNLMLDFWMKKKVEEIYISDTDAKAYYLQNIKKFFKPASVKVRHILVPTEEEAVAIIADLEQSDNLEERFIKLAKSESTGPSSVNGGELDWFVYEQMVPEFSDAAFKLKKGTITKQAVKTQFGYHVIFLKDKKEKGLIPFETVKKDIVTALRLKKFKTKMHKMARRLRESADISVK